MRAPTLLLALFPVLFSVLFLAFSSGLAGPARAEQTAQLRILTSMPPRFYTPFLQAFQQTNPTIDVVILNKNTNAAIDELLRGNVRKFDIFWSSSPEPFVLLLQNDLVARNPASTAHAIYPFAYSAFGWAQRSDRDAVVSQDWDSLLNPRNAGRIAMARPARSGSTHMMLERFFQVRGWHEGWAYLLELSANLSTLTARSFTVLDGVASGRFEKGLTIDFLAHSHQQTALTLTYGNPVMVTAAQIAVLRGGDAPEAAAAFAAFVVSDDGQRLLLQPQIARTPYSARIRAEAKAPHHRVVADALTLTWMKYDADLASRRYWAVNALFDAFIFEPLSRRQQLWQQLRQLEQRPGIGNRKPLLEARRLLTLMPVTEHDLAATGSATVAGAFVALPQAQNTQMQAWRDQSTAQLDAAAALLRQVEDQEEQP